MVVLGVPVPVDAGQVGAVGAHDAEPVLLTTKTALPVPVPADVWAVQEVILTSPRKPPNAARTSASAFLGTKTQVPEEDELAAEPEDAGADDAADGTAADDAAAADVAAADDAAPDDGALPEAPPPAALAAGAAAAAEKLDEVPAAADPLAAEVAAAAAPPAPLAGDLTSPAPAAADDPAGAAGAELDAAVSLLAPRKCGTTSAKTPITTAAISAFLV